MTRIWANQGAAANRQQFLGFGIANDQNLNAAPRSPTNSRRASLINDVTACRTIRQTILS